MRNSKQSTHAAVGPASVMSSMYAYIETPFLANCACARSRIGCRTAQKKTGPSTEPWRTPRSLMMMCLRKRSSELEPYSKMKLRRNGANTGLFESATAMASRSGVLKAFLASIVRTVLPADSAARVALMTVSTPCGRLTPYCPAEFLRTKYARSASELAVSSRACASLGSTSPMAIGRTPGAAPSSFTGLPRAMSVAVFSVCRVRSVSQSLLMNSVMMARRRSIVSPVSRESMDCCRSSNERPDGPGAEPLHIRLSVVLRTSIVHRATPSSLVPRSTGWRSV